MCVIYKNEVIVYMFTKDRKTTCIISTYLVCVDISICLQRSEECCKF